VQVLCYSKYFGFDAPIDPLSAGSTDPCEQTSSDALAGTIYPLLSNLDAKNIVGSRVDIVAHSMGGLAARYYASQSFYTSLRNRKQGQFHEIITLDTPELGSKLAVVLDTHSTCHGQLTSFDWLAICGGTTVAQCFAGGACPFTQTATT
jgi:PGAP1-like protein